MPDPRPAHCGLITSPPTAGRSVSCSTSCRTVYGRLARGEPADLPLPPFQYAGYASWTRVCQRSTAVELDRLNALRFWEETLAGVQDLDLPTDFTRPENLSNRGAIVSRSLEPETSESIRGVRRLRKLTPLSVWLAAVHLVLSRRSRQADFCMGVPVTGRGRPELSPLVGLFVNTLVVRLSGDVRDQTVGKSSRPSTISSPPQWTAATCRSKTSWPGSSHPGGWTGRLFSRFCGNYAADPPSPVSLGDCRLTPLLPESDSAKFEWTFSVTEQIDGGALIAVEYATDLYTPETAGPCRRTLSSRPCDGVGPRPTPRKARLRPRGGPPTSPAMGGTSCHSFLQGLSTSPSDPLRTDRMPWPWLMAGPNGPIGASTRPPIRSPSSS